MNITSKNVYSCLFIRPWLGVPLGLWIAVSVIYYWWLISRINILETQNVVFKKQLQISHTVMRQLSAEIDVTYSVPEVKKF